MVDDYRRKNAGAAVTHYVVTMLDITARKTVEDHLHHLARHDALTDHLHQAMAQARRDRTLLTQLEQPVAAALVAESILQVLSRAFRIQDRALDIFCSVGIALYPRDGADTATLMKHADSAMYQAKCAGRDCFRFYAGDDRAEDAAVPGVV
ncbi:diguanylate cyclase domain-containing protein [Methylomonas koyamae]|uniref:diguanylate cyclase domain-containing protein n=1 Tax=Methylomonas koyamae TaxID=702114 RepID=UPI000BC34EA3|nr:diguanylate cyclase [Methylomonas koyamae]ATG92105.1 hypothetical protein MKLM6_3928 [Methylomonas koyamae]